MTPQDWLLFRRTLLLACAVLGVATLVVVATDEAYSTAGMRAARLCAFAPAISAVAAWVTLMVARRRGELTALAALGASPWTTGWGALCAAWFIGSAAALLLLAPFVDVSSLFPGAPIASGWIEAQGTFLAPAEGIRVASDGRLSFLPKQAVAEVELPGRVEAMSAVLPQALVLPAWLLSPLERWNRAWGLLLSLALTLLAMHAAAIGRLPSMLLPLAAAPLGAQLAFSLERSRAQVSLFSAMLGRRTTSHD